MAQQIAESAVITGTPKQVWPLLTLGKHVCVWYAFGGADIDLRPSGMIKLRWDEHGEFDAVVESVIPEKLFSFRWLPAFDPRVEIELQSMGPHATRVQIVESGDLEDPAMSALAWRNGLRLLNELATSRQRSSFIT